MHLVGVVTAPRSCVLREAGRGRWVYKGAECLLQCPVMGSEIWSLCLCALPQAQNKETLKCSGDETVPSPEVPLRICPAEPRGALLPRSGRSVQPVLLLALLRHGPLAWALLPAAHSSH